jgi:glycosyltransferase involved in cell wall biosynthesis
MKRMSCTPVSTSMCDIETEQTAMGRGAFAMSKAFISHKHWFMGTAQMDATYQRAIDGHKKDERRYKDRRHMFEVYKFEDLFNGKVTEKPKEGLTVVIPSFNECDYLIQTVNSLEENTSQPYELIIIDDGSDSRTIEYIKTLNCVKVFNKTQKYVNANWNTGIRMAKNRWVVIANNDITFSKDWDKYLIEKMHEPAVWVVSPMQTDPNCRTPYENKLIPITGACFMIDKEMIDTTFYIPEDMLIWFGDSWLCYMCEKHNHKAVFTRQACIHHYGSKSSINMQTDRKLLFWQIIRGDAYAFINRSGKDIRILLEMIYKNLGLPLPV